MVSVSGIVMVFIFPASAGVFLLEYFPLVGRQNIPRIRGGVSTSNIDLLDVVVYSPHPRGCFQGVFASLVHGVIFPASAGVFPIYTT